MKEEITYDLEDGIDIHFGLRTWRTKLEEEIT